MAHQLLKLSNIDFKTKVADVIEERRREWVTHDDLNTWFDDWEKMPERFGFGHRESDDSPLVIPEDQRYCIVNLDESCLMLDGSNKRAGGRPAQIVHDFSLPSSSKRASKSDTTVTIVHGSNTTGESLSPHFQFAPKAKMAENLSIQTEALSFLKQV